MTRATCILGVVLAGIAWADGAPVDYLLRADFESAECVALGPAAKGRRLAAADIGCTLTPGRQGPAGMAEEAPMVLPLGEPLPTLAGTIAFWCRPGFASSDESEHVLFVVPAAEGQGVDNWQMQWRGNGELLARAGKMGGAELYLPSMRFSAGQWIHLAMAWDARNMSLYVDGKRAAADLTVDMSVRAGDTLYLGAWADGSRPSDAAFDELLVYPHKLSGAQIAALAGGDRGDALGPPPPAGRSVTRPGPVPQPSADSQGLLLHLSFDKWPSRWARLTKATRGPTSIDPVDGKFGKALEFRGGGAAVNVTDVFPHEAGTVTLWARPNWDGGHQDSKVFFHVPTDAPSVNNYHLQLWGGNLSARAGTMSSADTPGGDVTTDVVTQWQAGEWHFLAMTWGPDAVKLYVDGDPVAQRAPVEYLYRPGGRLTIGAWEDGNRSADSVLDEVRLFTEELTQEDIKDLFERNSPPGGEGQ